mmetsp:Transcript_20003/g.28925  ORF Transcript_20003/g.28925 Transcript_20003/m.28925 type:complete len:390 (+) Transcript_20003:16-1185(+)
MKCQGMLSRGLALFLSLLITFPQKSNSFVVRTGISKVEFKAITPIVTAPKSLAQYTLKLNSDNNDDRLHKTSCDKRGSKNILAKFCTGLFTASWLIVAGQPCLAASSDSLNIEHIQTSTGGFSITSTGGTSTTLLADDIGSLFGASSADTMNGQSPMELTQKQRQKILKEELKRQREEEKAAKLREYDAMFDQDFRERDRYYSDMLAKSRQKTNELLKGEKEYVDKGIMSNLSPDIATDRTGILPDALMSLQQKDDVNKIDLRMEPRSKQPSVDIDIKLQQMRVNNNPELEDSLEQIRMIREEDNAKVRALAEQNAEKQQSLIERNEAAKNEAMAKTRAKQLARIEEIRLQKEQERFERDMDFLDYLEKKEEKSQMMQERARIKFGVSQ